MIFFNTEDNFETLVDTKTITQIYPHKDFRNKYQLILKIICKQTVKLEKGKSFRENFAFRSLTKNANKFREKEVRKFREKTRNF